MKRSLWAWALAGALVAIAFWAVDIFVFAPGWGGRYGGWYMYPPMTFLEPGWTLVMWLRRATDGGLGVLSELALKIVFNALVYMTLGWTAWMGRHRSSIFYVLSGLVMAPFALMAAFQIPRLPWWVLFGH